MTYRRVQEIRRPPGRATHGASPRVPSCSQRWPLTQEAIERDLLLEGLGELADVPLFPVAMVRDPDDDPILQTPVPARPRSCAHWMRAWELLPDKPRTGPLKQRVSVRPGVYCFVEEDVNSALWPDNSFGHLRIIHLFSLSLLVFVGVPHALPAQDQWVGSIKSVEGAATVWRGRQPLRAKEGMHLMQDDLILTGMGGRLGAILKDGTRFSLGPETELRIDRFVYNPAESKFGLILAMLRGIAVFISGKLAEFSPESVRVETPVGIVGLRGTSFAITLEQP